MHQKRFRSLIVHTPAEGAGQPAPATPPGSTPATPAAGGTPAAPAAGGTPAAPAAPASPDILARLSALEGMLKTTEADKAALVKERDQATTAKTTLEERFAASEKERVKDKIDAALARESAGYQYASKTDAAHALKLFQADHKVEIRNGAALAIGPDGSAKHLANAFADWVKADGARYLAAPAQPGAASPGSPASPNAPTTKRLQDMNTEELRAYVRTGPTLKVTNDRHAPTVTIRRSSNSPLEARRAEMHAQMFGVNGSQK